MTDFRPDAQTLLMVVASVLSGILLHQQTPYPDLGKHDVDIPGSNDHLSRGRLSNTSLDDIAQVHLLDLVRLDTSLLNGRLDGHGTELGCSQGRERAVDAADGGTGARENVDVLNGGLWRQRCLPFRQCHLSTISADPAPALTLGWC